MAAWADTRPMHEFRRPAGPDGDRADRDEPADFLAAPEYRDGFALDDYEGERYPE
jgi:hypothetical protein